MKLIISLLTLSLAVNALALEPGLKAKKLAKSLSKSNAQPKLSALEKKHKDQIKRQLIKLVDQLIQAEINEGAKNKTLSKKQYLNSGVALTDFLNETKTQMSKFESLGEDERFMLFFKISRRYNVGDYDHLVKKGTPAQKAVYAAQVAELEKFSDQLYESLQPKKVSVTETTSANP